MSPSRNIIVALSLVALITVFHYATDMSHVGFHNVFRRLYYIPIVIAAFGAGLRGALATALLVCAAYLPHAFFLHHRDPSPTIDKLLEMVLYLAIGALAGWFVDQRLRAQRKLEATLEERDVLEQQLVRAGKLSALGELSAGIAHELRNPLASIQGAAEALAPEFPPEHRKHRMAQILLSESARLERVIADVLNFAHPAPPQRVPTSLLDVSRSAAQLASHRYPNVSFDIPNDPCPPLHIDPAQCTQVLLNLMLNAGEALNGGPARVDLRLEYRRLASRDYLCIGVHDTGPGIPEALREQVFDPFFTSRPEGTGLGLTISSRIMEAHKGFLDPQGTPGDHTVWACFPTSQ